ncbi:hypothetical protein ATZ36_00495 [Candidatus Endomicrobiellum trichonymphae]|jgi:hypothetical protein|uniref:Uncharacterized protein n=1 Tax=Endomicrobium trichonymphae TaxID=1408204 RepID=A0A1E5IK87_ENDTX|nr:hypothetical protein ATZ36_00495 [Candidatus Endomicrobium trichonymphae]
MRALPESILKKLDVPGTSTFQHHKQKPDCLKLQIYAVRDKRIVYSIWQTTQGIYFSKIRVTG